MFPKLPGLESEEKHQVSNLTAHQFGEPEHTNQSFPFPSTKIQAWVRASFSDPSAQPEN